MQFLNNYSNRELNIWAELILNIIVSLFFVSKIFPLIINGQFYSEALVQIILTTIIIAIIYSIIVFGTINTLTKREEKDERDYIYELKSYKISNNIYEISNYLIIGIIIFTIMVQQINSSSMVNNIKPISCVITISVYR